jgi:hypothetical protein
MAIAGIGAGALAGLAGLKSLMDYVASANKGLADLQTNAKTAGLNLADFQGLQFGGEIKGLTDPQINAGLQKSAQLLNDAQRNANTLSKELDANGLSIKNANGQLISENQLLGIAADLVRRAQSPQDQIAIAQMLGFTKEWIPLLQQGSDAMAGLTDEARKAGAIIDDETIQRAAEFDEKWRKSSVEFSANLKAALLGLLPYVDNLIDGAAKFIKSIDRDKIEQHAKDALGVLRDQTGIPEEGGIKIAVTTETAKALEDFRNAPFGSLEFWAAAGRALAASFQTIAPQDVKFYSGTAPVMDTSDDTMRAGRNAAAWTAEGSAWKKLQADIVAGADIMVGGFSKVASRTEETNDAFDRAVLAAKRHTDQLYADADAVGLGAGALAKFRTEAALTSAAEAAGKSMTDQLRASITDAGDSAADAANDLAKLKIASNIDFARQTALLSPQDVQIATQLRDLYGNDVPAALASSEAAAMRVNNAIKDGRDTALDFAKSFVSGLLQGKSGMEALTAAADQLAAKMADKALTDLFSGNFLQAGVEGVVAIGAALFSGDQKQKKELADAQTAWAKMADQVLAFNAAAAGFDLGPLTSQIQQLASTENTLVTAAMKAQDQAAVHQIQDTFGDGVRRIVAGFVQGAQTLSPLQQAMKAVNDEARGLKDELTQLHFDDLVPGVEASAAAQIQKLIAQFTDQLTSGLTERLNTANGKGYLNDAASVLAQHQADLASAAELGNDPAVLAQISATFHAEAQKVIEDAGLTGSAFDDFIQMFPDFSGVVSQSATALQAANDKFAAFTKTISDYLASLQVGSNSILSPQDQLAAAQGNFNQQLALAQAGDSGAQGSITQYASTLLDQAKSYYASSSGYADIYRAVTSALAGLTGSTAISSGSTSGSPAALTGNLSGIVPTVALAPGSASNDNGSLFATQTQTLVQAIASVGNAEIQTIKDENALLRGQVERLIAAVSDPRSRPARPSARVG